MIAIGMGIAWAGYSVALWGYCLLHGVDVKFTQLINPVHPYTGGFAGGQIPPSQLLPSGTAKTAAKATAV